MFGWLTRAFMSTLEFLVPFFRKKKGTLVFLGLNNAGKTTLLGRLKYDRMLQSAPTGQPTCEELQLGNVLFTTYDVGGHKEVRRLWRDYYPNADGIIFILDGSDRKRFYESKHELDLILGDENMISTPLAILINKIDLIDAASEAEVLDFFNLRGLTTGKGRVVGNALQGRRPLELFPCSVLRRQGYGEAFTWLANYF